MLGVFAIPLRALSAAGEHVLGILFQQLGIIKNGRIATGVSLRLFCQDPLIALGTQLVLELAAQRQLPVCLLQHILQHT